jgi:hypothetical protein
MFIGSDNRIAAIVDDIKPGDPGHWGHNFTSCVIELCGGLAREYDLNPGDRVSVNLNKTAQEFFDPASQRPDWHTRRPEDSITKGQPSRFKDHTLPDDYQNDMNYLDPAHWHEEDGYDVSDNHDKEIKPSDVGRPGL